MTSKNDQTQTKKIKHNYTGYSNQEFYNNLKKINLKEIYLKEIYLKEIYLKEIDLKEIDLKEIDLKEIDLKEIDLKKIDLKKIDLKKIDDGNLNLFLLLSVIPYVSPKPKKIKRFTGTTDFAVVLSRLDVASLKIALDSNNFAATVTLFKSVHEKQFVATISNYVNGINSYKNLLTTSKQKLSNRLSKPGFFDRPIAKTAIIDGINDALKECDNHLINIKSFSDLSKLNWDESKNLIYILNCQINNEHDVIYLLRQIIDLFRWCFGFELSTIAEINDLPKTITNIVA